MEVVIRLSKSQYMDILTRGDENQVLVRAVKQGIVLKPHGDLIDTAALEPDTEWDEYCDGFTAYSQGLINRTTPVLKANASDPEIGEASILSIAEERYADLKEFFADDSIATLILENREEFKRWLQRMKWHVRRADELAREMKNADIKRSEE